MAKLLLVISAALMVLVYNSYAATTARPHREHISDECTSAIQSGLTRCYTTASQRLNITNITKMTTKQSCCLQWDVIDCGLPIIKAKCNAKDLELAQAEADDGERDDGKLRCAEYKYHSDACRT